MTKPGSGGVGVCVNIANTNAPTAGFFEGYETIAAVIQIAAMIRDTNIFNKE